MSRSLATSGALTMLTESSCGFSRPCSRIAVSGRVFSGGLAGEGAELLGELHIGLEARRLLDRDRGHVDRVGDGAVQQEIRHLFCHLHGHIELRLGRGGAEMRRADDARMVEQDIVLRRLFGEDVQRRTGDVAGIQRCFQIGFDHEAAAGTIDQPDLGLALRQSFGVDDAAGLVGQRRVQADEIGALQQGVEIDLLDAEVDRPLRREERIEGNHLHLQSLGAVGDDRADIAATDDAERLGIELDADEAGFLPFAFMGGAVGQRDVPRQGHHHGDGVLGRRDVVAERRVHHADAARGRGLDVDVVDADPGAADDFEILRGGDHVGRGLCRRAHGKAVEAGDDLQQLLGLQADAFFDLQAAVLEDLHRVGGEFVCDQDFR